MNILKDSIFNFAVYLVLIFSSAILLGNEENELENEASLKFPNFFTHIKGSTPINASLATSDEFSVNERVNGESELNFRYQNVTENFNSALYYEFHSQNEDDTFLAIFVEGHEFGDFNQLELKEGSDGSKNNNMQLHTVKSAKRAVDLQLSNQYANSHRFTIY
jgi:hypothetical protein